MFDFHFHDSCEIGASQNKACSYCVMLVLRDRIIRSFRHELGSTRCCLRDTKRMSIGFLVRNMSYTFGLNCGGWHLPQTCYF